MSSLILVFPINFGQKIAYRGIIKNNTTKNNRYEKNEKSNNINVYYNIMFYCNYWWCKS